MRIFTLAVLACLPGIAQARDVSKSVQSGTTTRMYTYFSWDKNCQSTTGVVKLLSKPVNGTLVTSEVDEEIKISRTTGKPSRCAGTPIKGFRVEYTSNPGFKGNDTFRIEVSYKHKNPEIDTFTVNVQ